MAKLMEVGDEIYIDPEAVDAVYPIRKSGGKTDEYGMPVHQNVVLLNCGEKIEVLSWRTTRELTIYINSCRDEY